MANDKNGDAENIPTLASNHYFLFNKEFDATSCGEAMTFILERNLLDYDKMPEAIKLIINSPGGETESAFALIDVIEASRIPVWTFGLGAIQSCGLLLFMSGDVGHRYITKNTSILSHQYSWGSYGKDHELIARVKEFDLTRRRMLSHYKKYTGQTEAIIKKHLLPAEDVWLSPKEAIKYGVADKIIDTI